MNPRTEGRLRRNFQKPADCCYLRPLSGAVNIVNVVNVVNVARLTTGRPITFPDATEGSDVGQRPHYTQSILHDALRGLQVVSHLEI